MTPAERQELERLRVENRELRDELECWRANEAADMDDHAELQRVEAVRRAFGCVPGTAGLLLVLLDRPGHLFTKPALEASLPVKNDVGGERHPKIVDVYICKLRAALDVHGLRDAIVTRWGAGVFLDPALAPAIQRLLGEAAA